MHKVKPNFLIVGAAKAGTTALYYYLKQHKDIGFPDLKEPKYFSSSQLEFPHNGIGDASVDKYAIKNWEEYLELFQNLDNKKRIGEASPDYLFYHELTAPLIKEKLGDVPIVIILRNPVKRAFSAYSYMRRDSREKLDFEDALLAESNRSSKNWDFIWQYKKGSEYANQINTYIKNFSNVHIIIFEDFIKKPLVETNKVFEFLGLKKMESLNTMPHNVSGQPTNLLTKFILSRDNNISTMLREFVKKMFPRIILEKLSNKSLRKIEITKKEYSSLRNQLNEDIIKTQNVLNRKIEQWE